MTDTENCSQIADLVLQNGVVYAVDQNRSQAEAVAVHGNDIVFVRNNNQASQYIGPSTEVIDLAGKMADLVVLDRNLFESPVSEIAETNVLMTLFEGRWVYRANAV